MEPNPEIMPYGKMTHQPRTGTAEERQKIGHPTIKWRMRDPSFPFAQ